MKIYLSILLVGIFLGCGGDTLDGDTKGSINDTSIKPKTYNKDDSFLVKKGDKLKALKENTKIYVIHSIFNKESNVTITSGSVSIVYAK